MDPELVRKSVAILGSPDLAWLVSKLRKRFEARSAAAGAEEGGGSRGGRLGLPQKIQPRELEALNRLLGRRLPSGARSLELAELEAVLAHAGIPALAMALEALSGPLINRREERLKSERAWQGLFADARAQLEEASPLRSGRLEEGWLNELERSGLLRRQCAGDLQVARAFLSRAVKIVLSLPASGVSLAELAASCTGDSHALDPGTSLGTLVLRAVAAGGTDDRRNVGLNDDRNTEARRALWESVGVFCDELSASVLVLNLRADARSLCGLNLNAHAELGEPCRLMLRELLRHAPDFGDRYRGQIISICENPSVVAHMARHLGPSARPLVCIEGQPRTPASRLLRSLAAGGAVLRYHGDFDWEGLRIANLVFRRFGAVPWRMGAEDYLQARIRQTDVSGSVKSVSGIPLKGAPVEAEWDARLGREMKAASVAIHEESLLEELCRDLALPNDIPLCCP